ncbi:hypothetical protein ScPMuIL_013673 [Solemya velum]
MAGKRKFGKNCGVRKKKQKLDHKPKHDKHSDAHSNRSEYKQRKIPGQLQPLEPKGSIDDSSSESESEENSYQQLLASIESKKQSQPKAKVESKRLDEDFDAEKDGADTGSDLSDNGSEAEQVKEDTDLSDGDMEEDDIQDNLTTQDPFSIHFETDLEENLVEALNVKASWKNQKEKITGIGSCIMTYCSDSHLPASKELKNTDIHKVHVKQKLLEQLAETNQSLAANNEGRLSKLQMGVFNILNNYQDLCYTGRTHQNGEQIRLMYCMHALNHVLKTRSRVVVHNTKLKMKQIDPNAEEHRDQGLTRPKVLIVLPFRESALRVVKMMMSLLMAKQESNVSNKKRFFLEYKDDIEEQPRKGYRPEEFDEIFAGNIDDHFRIGLGVAKKTLKLYTKFYAADIILASPLGLRTVIGTEGEKDRDYDFLNSIEMLILDQADIFLMQNWDHITNLMNHLHLQPQESHGVDFSRVRMWTLNGWSKYYRQTLIFSSVVSPEINSLYKKHCSNYAGKIQFLQQSAKGSICQIIIQLPQIFHKVECSSFTEVADRRFDFFIKNVLPSHRDPVMSQTCIFIPSYFDFVRVRNYFAKEELDFLHINEYSSDKVISKARNQFFHRKVHFLLYTERFHFYKRYRIRGIRNLVFYELPHYPHFYSELCNMILDPKKQKETDNLSTTILYSKYDVQKLSQIVGTERASHMINSEKIVHMFVTGENS